MPTLPPNKIVRSTLAYKIMAACHLWEKKRDVARSLGISNPNDPNEWLGVPTAILKRKQLLSEDPRNIIHQLQSLKARGLIKSESRRNRSYIRLTDLGRSELERMVGSYDEQIFFYHNA